MEKSLVAEDRLEPWTPRALSILRIVTGLLFLEHGTQKVLGFPPRAWASALSMIAERLFSTGMEA